jgi:hypothetical protein
LAEINILLLYRFPNSPHALTLEQKKILTQGIDKAMIYLGNFKTNSYISVAKPKNTVVFALTDVSEILALLYGDFGMNS